MNRIEFALHLYMATEIRKDIWANAHWCSFKKTDFILLVKHLQQQQQDKEAEVKEQQIVKK